jgi:hypothetical protein
VAPALPALVAVGLGIGRALLAWQDASQVGGWRPPPWYCAKAVPVMAVSIKLAVTAKAKPMVLLVADIKLS